MKKQTQQPHDDPAPAPSRSTVLLLLGTMGDTSLRLFIPTIGGTVLGLWADNQFATTPWATVVGVIIGAVTAFGLVYAQLKKINREQTK